MSQRNTVTSVTAQWIDTALWAFAFMCAAMTVYFSLGPVPPGTEAFRFADKVWHFLAYAASVAGFLFAAVWRPGRGPGRFPWATSVIVFGSVALGGAIELLQGHFFGRTMDPMDALADLMGSLAAFVFWRLTMELAPRA